MSSHGTSGLKKVSRPEKHGRILALGQKIEHIAYFLWARNNRGMDLSLRFWPRIDGRRLLRFGLLSLLGWSSHWFMVATQEILEVQWSRKKKSFKVHFARLDFAKNFHSGFRKQLPNVSLNPLGKYRESPHLKIPSGLWRRKLGLEQTFVNFQSCQRCKKKLAFTVAWSQPSFSSFQSYGRSSRCLHTHRV